MSTTAHHAVPSSRSLSDPALYPSHHAHDSARTAPRGDRRTLYERVRTFIDRTLDAAFGRFEF
jgi:hypothetical protein